MSLSRRVYHRELLWLAAIIHRLSGLGLAIFLPLHFLVLGLAISGAGRLQGALRLTQMWPVQIAEGVLIFLLVVHLLGGIRLLAFENGPWFSGQRAVALLVILLAAIATFFFLVRVM